MRSERLNAIARLASARRYLEIGVSEGDTFFGVDVEYKVAVDPAFNFDYKTRQTEKQKFFPLRSDDFFKSERHQAFDLIYLDGLHTFEQTLRDFMNSLTVAHAKTVWLLDDTIPNDNYSALADQDRCYRLRRSQGNGDWAWMGDVYKVVFFIASVMRFYQVRTFTGHGQTVVWRDLNRFSDPIDQNLEAIGTMTYEDFIEKHQSVFHVAPDESIFADLREFLTT